MSIHGPVYGDHSGLKGEQTSVSQARLQAVTRRLTGAVDSTMAEGHAAVVYGVTIGRVCASPAAFTPISSVQSPRGNQQCSVRKVLEQKVGIKVKESGSRTDWLLPAQQVECTGLGFPQSLSALALLPRRERQLPANWRSSRQSTSVQPSAGDRDDAAAVVVQPKDLRTDLEMQAHSNPSGPYTQAYGAPIIVGRETYDLWNSSLCMLGLV